MNEKKKIPAVEIAGETCAKPLPKKRKVFSSDGKSMWYEEEKKPTRKGNRKVHGKIRRKKT